MKEKLSSEDFKKAKEALEKANVPFKYIYLTEKGWFNLENEISRTH